MKGRYLFKHALAQSPNCVGTHTETFYARLMLIDMLIEKKKAYMIWKSSLHTFNMIV